MRADPGTASTEFSGNNSALNTFGFLHLLAMADAIVNELHTLPLVFEDRIAKSQIPALLTLLNARGRVKWRNRDSS